MVEKWTAAHMPDQQRRVALITGANSGIGLEAAAALASKGARVVLLVRNIRRSDDAVERIKSRSPRADLAVQSLDLTSLASVRSAAAALKEAYPRIDVLINNAGIALTPRAVTADGFESQFGTNHLGHFALTGLLLDHMLPVVGSRVVTISSFGHRIRPTIDFDDLHAERHYQRSAAYGRSKLANLLFTYELQRKLATAGANTIAVAAHPGTARSDLLRDSQGWVQGVSKWLRPLLFQSSEMGALPTLRAATDPAVVGGQFYGPRGLGQRGYPKQVKSSKMSHDKELQRRLWTVSEELTGVRYPT